jgi:hypothetical protein
LSSLSSKFDEELEEPLCGFPPLPLTKKNLLDYLFEGASRLFPWEVDKRESFFFLLPSLVVLKFVFNVVAALLSLEGRVVT